MKKIKQWFRLVLMFYIVLLVIGLMAQWASPGSVVPDPGRGTACYLPIYTYHGDPGYVAAVCSTPHSMFSLLRISASDPPSVTANNLADATLFLILLVAGLVTWFRFIIEILPTYLPWLGSLRNRYGKG
ncbi:hypothetical protein [Marinobacter sp. R17]|uniref:hypothetical protein n=1 Tax=Marinobacter sp. R17 TaxID=2484250 RepID=UPI000F4BB558|nr:hypothetical protein [Marinobacter sp. R17]